MSLAFEKTGGKAITIEYEPESALEAKRNFRKAGLDDVNDSRINDAPDIHDFLDAIKNDPELETSIHETSAEGIQSASSVNKKLKTFLLILMVSH